MKRYIFHRLLQLIPILFGITLLTFLLLQLAGGDAVDALYNQLGVSVDSTVEAKRRAALGLNRPLHVQYLRWLTHILTGDFGTSYISGQPVADLLLRKLPNTVLLAVTSLALALLAAVPLGCLAAQRRNTLPDYAIRAVSFVSCSTPGFLVGLVLMLIFAVRLHWARMTLGSGLQGLALPALTLAIAMGCKYTRQVRAAVLEEMHQDYVVGARALGIPEARIFTHHILRNATPVLVNLTALSLGSLLGGAVVVETLFMWDGLGYLATQAIAMRDVPVIQAYVLWMALAYVLLNLLADLIVAALNPKIRLAD